MTQDPKVCTSDVVNGISQIYQTKFRTSVVILKGPKWKQDTLFK